MAEIRISIEGAQGFNQKLRDINNKLAISRGELEKVANGFAANERAANTLAQTKDHLSEALQLNAERQAALNSALEAATTKYGKNSSEALELRASIIQTEAAQSDLERQLRETQRAMDGQDWSEFGRGLEAASRGLTAAGDKMKRIGQGLSSKVTAPLVSIGKSAISMAADFGSAMNDLQRQTGMSAHQAEQLGRAFREMALSGDYGTFSAREIAAAYDGVAEKGHDAAYAQELMRAAMVLATATGTDLGDSARILSSQLENAGKGAGAAESLINTFAAASSRTGIGLDSLSTKLGNTNRALDSAGISTTAATAVFGNLYAAGIRGSQAYDGMNGAINALLNPSDKLNGLFDSLNVSAFNMTDTNRSALDVLFELADAAEQSGDSLKSYKIMQELSSAAGEDFAAQLLEGRGAIAQLIPELYEIAKATDGTGVAFAMAAEHGDCLTSKSAKLRSAFEDVKIQIGQHLMPHAQMLIGGISSLVERFANLNDGTQKIIIGMAAMAAAAGPLLKIGGNVATLFGGVTGAAGKLTKAIGAAGGAKAYLAKKFPVITAGLKATTAATIASGKANTVAAAKMKTFAAGMKAKAAGMGIVKVGLTAVSAGFIKLTAAMLANPIGAIIAGVAALTAGIIALVTILGRASEEYKEMAEDSANWLDKQRDITNAAAASAEAFEQSARAAQNNAKHYDSLAAELMELAGQHEHTAAEMAQMEYLMERLNSSTDGLNLAFDEQTGALSMTADALASYMTAARAQETLDAKLKERNRLQLEAREIADGKAESERRLLELQEKQEDGSRRNRRERNLLADAIAYEKEALALLTDAFYANGEMQDALTDGIYVYREAVEQMRIAQIEAASSLDTVTDALHAQQFTIEQWEKAQSDALKKIQNAFESYKNIATNAFDRVGERAELSADEMIANMRHNTDAMEQWSKDLAELVKRGVDEGLVEQLRAGGVESRATVSALVDACDEEIAELNDVFARGIEAAMDTAKRAMDPHGIADSADELIDHVALTILNNNAMDDALIETIGNAFSRMGDAIDQADFGTHGEATIGGYVQGIYGMQQEVDKSARDTANTYMDGITNELDMRSPSREMQKIGKNASKGLILGAARELPQVEQTARSIARALISTLTSKMGNFQQTGTEIASGVARGIANGGGIVQNAASGMINNALSAMRAAAQINSPSRATMAIADFLMQGIVDGTTKRLEDVRDASADVMYNFTDGLMDGYAEMFGQLEEIVAASGSDLLKAELANFDKILDKTDSKNDARSAKEQSAAAKRVRDFVNFNTEIVEALGGHHNQLAQMVQNANREEETIIEDSMARQIRARLDIIGKHIRAVQDSTRDIIAEYDKQHRALMQSMDDGENEALRALQGRIDAISEQTQAENEAIREQQEQRRLADLQAAIDAAKTSDERAAATERFNEEAQRQQREALLRARSAEQASLREQMQDIRENYRERRSEAKANHQANIDQARADEKVQLEFLQSLEQIEQNSFDARQKQLDGYLQNQQRAVEQSQRNLTNTLNSYIPRWSDASRGANQAYLREIQNAMPKFEEAGKSITTGVARGITSGGSMLSGAAANVIHMALAAMRAAAAINSPSRATMTLGGQLMDGLMGGMQSKMGELAAYCKSISDKVISALATGFDGAELIKSSKSALAAMGAALPALESGMHHVLGGSNNYSQNYTINMGGTYHIREEADVARIADSVARKLGKDVDNFSKTRGVRIL